MGNLSCYRANNSDELSYSSTENGNSSNCKSGTVTNKTIKNPKKLQKYIDTQLFYENWSHMNIKVDAWSLIELNSYSEEYKIVAKRFRTTTKRNYKLTRIRKIQNPYLYAAYLLKKEEMKDRYGKINERLLFHGTRQQCVDDICKNNFDWRRHGQNNGTKFGKGVCFTPFSCYASHYSDKKDLLKVMFLAKVLVSNSAMGTKDMELPPDGFDATHNRNEDVIVKYEDNEFYPAYLLDYYINKIDDGDI